MARQRFSKGQMMRISEIFGNLSIAWFTAGIISPLFIRSQSFIDFFLNFSVSLVISGILASWSVYLMKGIK